MQEFKDIVRNHLQPLANDYGLVCTVATNRLTRFENDKIFLQVRFDLGRSFEIGFEVGLVQQDKTMERPFSLAEILRLKNFSEPSIAAPQAIDQILQEKIVGQLASLIRKYGHKLLEGSAEDFLKQNKFRDQETGKYAIARDLRYARSNAEIAWKQRDFKKIVSLYAPLRFSLVESERRRLKYAEEHLIDRSKTKDDGP